MNGNEFCSINTRRAYERDIRCDIDDPRYSKNGIKKEFLHDVPEDPFPGRFEGPPHNFPKGMIWCDGNGRQIPDFINQFYRSYSARVRDLVETLQPGVLGWIPVTFTYSRGKWTEERFFIDPRSVPKVDLVDVVASNMGWIEQVHAMLPAGHFRDYTFPMPAHCDPTRDSVLHFRSDIEVPFAMFEVKGLSQGPNFVSAGLRDAFVAAGVFGAVFNPVPFGTPASPVTAQVLRPC